LLLLKTNDDWTTQDVKSTGKSLNTRLDALKKQFEVGSRRSVAQTFLSSLLNEAALSKEHLLETIETIDSELSELESTVAGLSTLEDTAIPEGTGSLNESPEIAFRKRAWISILLLQIMGPYGYAAQPSHWNWSVESHTSWFHPTPPVCR
jgi:hypothetical protein